MIAFLFWCSEGSDWNANILSKYIHFTHAPTWAEINQNLRPSSHKQWMFQAKSKTKIFLIFFYGEGTFYSLAKKSPPSLLNNELFLRHFFIKCITKKTFPMGGQNRNMPELKPSGLAERGTETHFFFRFSGKNKQWFFGNQFVLPPSPVIIHRIMCLNKNHISFTKCKHT